ncbi:hypothetical protein SAMN04488125_10854 [Methylorubrum salsuginis]|uniref:Uncharacterized protein n=1 Tax=Methylorubrum salsuginis TaxID=414703 RepID=A0A1I4EMB9_9HYPH|nr:hypothetical protein SAMN04488125_10854 [Methylorubrum salsuginis]
MRAQSNAPVVLGDYYEDKAVVSVSGVSQVVFKFAAIPSGKFLTVTDVGCMFNQTTAYVRLHLALGSKYGATDNARFHPLRVEMQALIPDIPNAPPSGSNFNLPANFKFGSSSFPSLVFALYEKGGVAGTCFIRGKLSTT